MSDKDKNSEKNKGGGKSSEKRLFSANENKKVEFKAHVKANKTEGKSTIVIKGQGAGDRPKRDTE